MNLYKISQTENTGYDTYSDAVVAAENDEEARNIHPSKLFDGDWKNMSRSCGWCSNPDKVTVEFIGVAQSLIKKGIICSSFCVE
jgi:hypothetical protein